MKYNGYRDLRAYQLAFQLSMDVFEITKTYPKEERYSLTDQIRRSSRSVAGNIAEAWMKRRYRKLFVSKIIDSFGEAGETEVWLDISRKCGYISETDYSKLYSGYQEINRILNGIIENAHKFCH